MALFVFALDQAEEICGCRDNPKMTHKWRGMKCTAKEEVVKLHTWD